MTALLRVAALQLRCGIHAAENRAHAFPLVQEAVRAGAQLVVTPENTLRLDRDHERLLAATASAETDAELALWSQQAKELKIWLLVGSAAISASPGKVFNRSFLFGPDGSTIARYDKIHLFDVQLGGGEVYRESATVQPGNKMIVAEGPGGINIGMSICYDLRFPQLYSALAQAGAHIITVPSAFTATTGQAHWHTLVRARAIETGTFVVAPAQGGRHQDGRTTWGRSMIVGPWGEVVASLDHDEPGFIHAQLDIDLVRQAHAKVPAWSGGPPFTVG